MVLRHASVFVVALVPGWSSLRAEEPPPRAHELTAKLHDDRVEVLVDGRMFTCYVFSKNQKYPYFFPVNGPKSGKSVTTESSTPYPHHHSLFFGCDRVSGGNFWQDVNKRGQIISEGPRLIERAGRQVIIEDRCRWQRPGAPDPFHDKRRIVIASPTPELRTIDFSIELEAQIGVHIEPSNHALFSARMAPNLAVDAGGRLVNADGETKHAGTHGKHSAWCDYSGQNEGHQEGLAILDWPENRWYPCTWFTRDYGFFSPSPMYWIDREGLHFARGEKLALRYLVVVHAGDEKDAGIAGIFERWSQGARPAVEGE